MLGESFVSKLNDNTNNNKLGKFLKKTCNFNFFPTLTNCNSECDNLLPNINSVTNRNCIR